MKDYATFLMFGALCLGGCASEMTPSSQTNTVSAGSGAAGSTQTGSAGSSATPMMSSAASAGRPASSGAAGSATATATATAGKSGSAAPSSAAGGGGSGAAPMGLPSNDAAPGTFRNVYNLALRDMCITCHTTSGLFGSPDLSSPETAYESLVDKEASSKMPGQCAGKGKLVTPGNCETSLLYNKVTQQMPTCGRRMPLSSDSMPQLIPQAGLDALCEWIKAGAKKDM